jgi:hypothetical protein
VSAGEFFLGADVNDERQLPELYQLARRQFTNAAARTVRRSSHALRATYRDLGVSSPTGEQRSKFAKKIEQRDHGNSYDVGIISGNVKSDPKESWTPVPPLQVSNPDPRWLPETLDRQSEEEVVDKVSRE